MLSKAIKAVLPHVGKSSYSPIRGVHFVENRVVATDRFTVGISRHDIKIDEPFTIDAQYAKMVASSSVIYKAYVQGNMVYFDTGEGEMVFPAIDGEYPNVERLITPSDGDGVSFSELLVFPDQVARFGKRYLARSAEEKKLGVRLHQARHGGPIFVSFSDHFRGAVMPARAWEIEN